MAEAAVVGFQSKEFARASVMYSDLELAFQLQLNEALAASASSSGVNFVPGREIGTGADEMSLAFQMQRAELRRREQELIDHGKAQEMQGLAVEIKRSLHDVEFARSIADMSDDEWEHNGDNFEKPFVVADDGSWDETQVCSLYFAKAREDSGHVGMAWAVTDPAGNVLLQQSKYLGVGISTYEADYTALLSGLEYARSVGLKRIVAHGNSLAVANQVSGQWRTHTLKQIKFVEQVQEYQNELGSLSIDVVPKAKNGYVLNLAKQVIHAHVTGSSKTHPQDPMPSQSKSQGKSEDCPICFERTQLTDMFVVRGCAHQFCLNCLSRHVEVQVKANQVPVRCPQDCSNDLKLDQCQPFLPPKVLESFTRCLAEASIPESDRVYCPFPNCSALMSKGGLSSSGVGSSSRHPHATSIGCTECMECHRLFCVECQVPWHADLSCEDYQKLPPEGRDLEDSKLYKLASHKNWQRCKKCRRMIELDQGCYHMTCRCGHEFCYTCGAEWKSKEATCKCKLWDENNIIHDPLSESDYDSDSDYESETDYFNENIYYKTKICRHWQGGYCRAGNHCTFAHGEGELRMLRRY